MSPTQFAWMDPLIRICGDLLELWSLAPSPIAVPSESENTMALDISSVSSLHISQTMPLDLLDASSFDAGQNEVDSAGTSAMNSNGFDALQPFVSQSVSNRGRAMYDSASTSSNSNFPYPSVSNHAQAMYDGASTSSNSNLPYPSVSNHARAMYDGASTSSNSDLPYPLVSIPAPAMWAASSNSLPYPSLSDSAFGVYGGELGTHSLPNLPFGDASQGMGTGGVDGSWSGYSPVSSGQAFGAAIYSNLQSIPYPSMGT